MGVDFRSEACQLGGPGIMLGEAITDAPDQFLPLRERVLILEVDVEHVQREGKLLVFAVVTVIVGLELRARAAADLALPLEEEAGAGESHVPVEKRGQRTPERQVPICLAGVRSICLGLEEPGVPLVRIPINPQSGIAVAKPAPDEV